MKLLSILPILISSASAFAQFSDVTVTLPDPSASEWAISTTYEATAFPNIISYIQITPPNGGFPNTSGNPSNTTLAAAITGTGSHANCTTFSVTGASANAICDQITLTSTTNLAQCNGLLIGTEVYEVYAVSGQTVTVLRGEIGTTKATASNGAAVTVLKVGGGTCLTKAILADQIKAIVLQQLSDSADVAAKSSIATGNATISTTAATAIQ
jgi:hypothetical protein